MSYPVHPAADVWPMLPDNERDALAQSIRTVGLLEPLVLWEDDNGVKWLLDGRNRLAACELAGVTPRYVDIDIDDPVAYVLSRNENRRHLTPSQRAMLQVRLGDPCKYLQAAGAEAGVSHPMIVHARKVAEHAPDLVVAVIAGTIPVKRAADEAERRRIESERTTAAVIDDERWLRYLRVAHPDLAERYDQGASRAELQDEMEGREQNATIVPKIVVDRVVTATAELRREVETLALYAETIPLGTHGVRLPMPAEFIHLARLVNQARRRKEPEP